MEADADARAIEALKRGDRTEAVTALISGYGKRLFQYCCWVLQDGSLAKDVHQTIFVQAYKDLGSFSGDSFREWLYAIAHNRCMDALKTTRRWRARFSLAEASDDQPDPSPSTEDRLIIAFAVARLNDCLKNLNTHVRIPVILRHLHGLPYDEIGRICKEDPAILKVRVARALPVLRKCLVAKGVQL